MSRLSSYREAVLGLGYDSLKARVLETAFELDIFESLAGGMKTARTLARERNANEESLELFLNALVACGFLATDGRGFQNTKYGQEIFLDGKSLYVGDYIALQARSAPDWLRLKDSVLSGTPLDRPDFLKVDQPELTRGFARAMYNTAIGHAHYLARRLPLGSAKTLLDLGGGPGAFAIHFVQANPGLRATIFDLPASLEIAREYVEGHGVSDRVDFQAGDFHRDEIQGSFDVCFLSHIIHGQRIEHNQALLAKIFAHLNSGGKLIVQDFFLNSDRQSPQFASLFALVMLLHTDGGRTYTFEEVEGWMSQAGFSRLRRPAFKLPRSMALLIAEK